MSEYIQITATVATQREAMMVAEQVVRERLAACVQVSGPVVNTHWSNGLMESTDVWICAIKTRSDCFQAVEATIHMLRPKKFTEIVALPFVSLADEYRQWIDRELDKSHGQS